jgi:hypothetical protein
VSVCAQILGGSELPSLLEGFSRIQGTTLSDTGSQLSFECNGDRAAFIAALGGSSSSRGGLGDKGGRASHGGHDSGGGARLGSLGPRKCSRIGCKYTPSSFASYLFDKGIINHTSYVHTPQQNGGRTQESSFIGCCACSLISYARPQTISDLGSHNVDQTHQSMQQ